MFSISKINPQPKKMFYEGENICFENTKLLLSTNFDLESFGNVFPKELFEFSKEKVEADLHIETLVSNSDRDLKDFIEINNFELTINSTNIEGYLIKVEKDKKVKIFSKSKRGLFYALQTFKSLIDWQLKCLPVVEIYDFPSFEMRGIIEGFYGKPWNHKNRMDILNFCGKNKMNTYWYAPKDDPYHREKWREDYPQNEMERLEELIKLSKENFVDFVFCVSPGLSIKFSDQKEFELLSKKYYELFTKGIKNFAILFDDIPEKLFYEEDEEEFKGNYGLAQTYITNKLYEFLKEKDSNINLYFCPTEYWQKEDSLYRRTIKETLNTNIPVIWTGDGVWSKRVSRKNADEVSNQFGHELILWDNYPVNDADKAQLFLAPVMNRESDLHKSNVKGVLSNPMNQPCASMIALGTIADYLWNSEGYEPWESWKKSIFNLVGSEYYKQMKLFSENFLNSRLFNETSSKLKKLIKDYNSDPVKNKNGLIEYLIELENLSKNLEDIDKSLYLDIEPWLNKLSKLSTIVINLLTMSAEEKKENIEKLEKEMERLGEYIVCGGILEKFAKNL
ncbi:beta-N-acetylglucosaminidase domain-containing protein [Petrotoga sp. 9PW.55.5.1]|uniref:protein O-GlcNAcase n=1 Tax=Petrotoga sp. 9PW.55.5.1 TaxID=1308979 RepID=UPI000DD60766|nr:beta-N-acetylglucosaminidase domain-containing protein [Petrotoga sp. 9PW.55.5.1]